MKAENMGICPVVSAGAGLHGLRKLRGWLCMVQRSGGVLRRRVNPDNHCRRRFFGQHRAA